MTITSLYLHQQLKGETRRRPTHHLTKGRVLHGGIWYRLPWLPASVDYSSPKSLWVNQYLHWACRNSLHYLKTQC